MRETSGVAGGRSDRVSWELAKRFVPPRIVPTELVCNSISSTTGAAGCEADDTGGVLRTVARKCICPVQTGRNYRIRVFDLMEYVQEHAVRRGPLIIRA